MGQSSLGRRRLVLYMAAIAVPTLVLLALGLQSIARQRAAVAALERANLALQAERLAAEIERRLTQAATSALGDSRFEELWRVLGGEPPNALARAAPLAQAVLREYPVARHLFLVEEGTIQWPARVAPLPVAPVRLVTPDESAAAPRYAALLARAERLELRANAPQHAAPVYRQLAEASASPALRALALSRVARSELRAGRRSEAGALWREIARNHGDSYDPYSQPYGLVAALALADVASETDDVRDDLLRAYDSLVDGRWALTMEQAEYFLGALEERLRTDATSRPRTRFLESIDFGEALGEWFSGHGDVGNTQVVAGAAGRDRRYDVHYTAGRAAGRQIGIALDTEWVARELVERTRQDLQIPGLAAIERGRTLQETAPGAGSATCRGPSPRSSVAGRAPSTN